MSRELTPEDHARYEWQMWIPDLGPAGQKKLKNSAVLISRVGGLGGLVAYELAAAGIGKLILAHGGNLKPSDLNRQLLMSHDKLGQPRIEQLTQRLKAFNPDVEIQTLNENVAPHNVQALVSAADVVVDCAPKFEERYLLNEESVKQKKPMVEAAMYELEASLTTFIPGKTPCLTCLYPEKPPNWKRQFPVLGGVAGTAGCLAAIEAVKVITGIGKPLTNRMLMMDLREMNFKTVNIKVREGCPVCQS